MTHIPYHNYFRTGRENRYKCRIREKEADNLSKPYLPLKPFSDPRNYGMALSVSRNTLAAGDPLLMAARSGCSFDGAASVFAVTCLDHLFNVSYPAGQVRYAGTELEPWFSLQIIMLNYLARADGTPLTYNFIPYRELDGGRVYYDAFHRTAIRPLIAAFGPEPELLPRAAAPFGGIPYSRGSGTGVLLFFLPRVPLLFQVWPGDEEFPPGGSILFDASANHYLHTEDLAAMDLVTRLLIKNLQSI